MQPHGCTLAAVVVMWKQKHNKCIDLNTECSLLTPSPHKHNRTAMCACVRVCAVKKNLKQRRKTENERERARRESERAVRRACIVKFTNTKARLTDSVAA